MARNERQVARWCVCVAMLCLACTAVYGADWPQWRGSNRDGQSPDTGLLRAWPDGGPPLAWKVDGLGGGYSAPSVAGGRIYGMSNRGQDEVVWALSEAEGKAVWVTRLGPAFRQRASQGKEGPACTPTVDGDRLYVIGLGGNIACLRVQDGNIVWQRSMTEDFGGRVPMWSYRESPLVDGDKVICTPGGEEAVVVALNKATGETIWKAKMPAAPAGESPSPGGFGGRRGGFGGRGGRGGRGGAAYASAVAIDFAGQRQYVQLTAQALIGVAADGTFLWRYDRPANRMGINCSTPIYQDGQVFASSAYGAGGGLARLIAGQGGSVTVEQVYDTTEMQNHHGGLILLDGYLYGASGGNEGGAPICMEFKSGKVMWDLRKDGQRRAKGSIAYADGRLYYRMEDGTVVLIEPDPERYVERGRFMQPDRSGLPAWPHPVIANGRLYLRDQDVLLCYDIKDKQR